MQWIQIYIKFLYLHTYRLMSKIYLIMFIHCSGFYQIVSLPSYATTSRHCKQQNLLFDKKTARQRLHLVFSFWP